MSKQTPGPWYTSSTGNHQGLIISEKTGENVAVSYDSEDAALIAAAPEMFDILNDIRLFGMKHDDDLKIKLLISRITGETP